MRIAILSAIIICLYAGQACAQGNELEKHVAKGVELHDKGNYTGALSEFEKALSIDPASPLAHSEMANTYFAMKDYNKAIEHSDRVIAAGTRYVDQAYINKGSSLDMQGKSQEAVKVYKEGIKAYPKSHLLYYNLAFTSYTLKEDDQSEEALEKALVLAPSHASSHLLMGYVMKEKGDRVKSLLALYNFLMLEPTGNRAQDAYALASQEMKTGVVKENEKKTTIYVSGDKLDTADHFSTANFWLSMLEAGKDIDKKKKRSEAVIFMDNSKAFLSMLGALRKNDTGFWWDYYVSFYTAMLDDKGRAETFGHIIAAASDDTEIVSWIKKNKSKLEALGKWYEGYERK